MTLQLLMYAEFSSEHEHILTFWTRARTFQREEVPNPKLISYSSDTIHGFTSLLLTTPGRLSSDWKHSVWAMNMSVPLKPSFL